MLTLAAVVRLSSALLVLVGFAGVSAAPLAPEDGREHLQELRQRIGALEETVERTRGQREDLLKDLAEIERRAGDLGSRLHALEADLAERSQALERLQRERGIRRQRLQGERAELGEMLRSAYKGGRQERLKLLLSQEDPAVVNRVVSYLGYLGRARAERIRNIQARLAELRAVEAEVADERAQIADLRAKAEAERGELDGVRLERRALVSSLERALQEQSAELRSLRLDAEEIETLVERLEAERARGEGAQRRSISGLKGDLSWPVQGRLSTRFGTQRASGGLTWDGVVISAGEGSEVRSLYYGRVAFADWLRGFGLLIILDHGDGYMSLYGFNQALLKETGEWVERGETIALVGDSGGRNFPSLYFGIRHRGRPLDPRQWCRRLEGANTVSWARQGQLGLAYNGVKINYFEGRETPLDTR